jgi:peptide-methionine (S)-S-oxide reductase
MKFLSFIFCFSILATMACAQAPNKNEKSMQNLPKTTIKVEDGLESAILGGGCFWCTEAIYQDLIGVQKVLSGYSGGHVDNPTYRQVTSGTTGHAEVIQVVFDPKVISFEEILEVFWATHDPTTLNRQGADVGPQYRSAVFYLNEDQKQKAEFFKKSWMNPVPSADRLLLKSPLSIIFMLQKTTTRIISRLTGGSLIASLSSDQRWRSSKKLLLKN